MKMSFPRLRSKAIAFCLFASIFAGCSGKLVISHHPAIENGASKNLTCISENDDDSSALIWNYNPAKNQLRYGDDDVFTNFKPKKRASKYFDQCAFSNSMGCLAKWDYIEGWELVDSIDESMNQVFDHRWEDFEEFVPEKSIDNQGYQYVGRIKNPSGTVVFSVRGSKDTYIFLCEDEQPGANGSCFWLIIGGWDGKRSEIRSCVNGGRKNCATLASFMVSHGDKSILNAYEWRTFRLEWNSDQRTIKVYNETDVAPFLEGMVTQWYPASHLFIQSEPPSRVRFHFYKYLLSKKKNAVLSTSEFDQRDEKFCFDTLVGLCAECGLNITLVNGKDGETPIAIISGSEGPSNRERPLTWRSARINVTLPKLNGSRMKLRMATILTKDGVEGRWAIDNFRSCKSAVRRRESTITIHREMHPSGTYSWPVVKCQKLSYGANAIVDSISTGPHHATSRGHLLEATTYGLTNVHRGFETDEGPGVNHHSVNTLEPTFNETRRVAIPEYELARSKLTLYTGYELSMSRDSGGPLLKRKARSGETDNDKLSAAELYVYEADPKKNTISVRLSPLNPTVGNVEQYKVYLIRKPSEAEPEQDRLPSFPVKDEGLECTLWENSVCLENIALDSSIKLAKDETLDDVYGMKVEAEYKGQRRKEWNVTFPLGFYKDVSSEPTNFTLTAKSHGIVTVKWGHPLFPHTKIEEFRIYAVPNNTNLLSGTSTGTAVTYVPRPFKPVEKMYQVELRLLTSTMYYISILAINQNRENGVSASKDFWVPSEVTFATGEDLEVNQNGTSIELKIPAVVNATRNTWINVTMKGPIACTPEQSPESTSSPSYESSETEWVVAQLEVKHNETTCHTFDANETIGTLLSCYLGSGVDYKIMVTVRDKNASQSDTRTSEPITFTSIDGMMPSNETPNDQELDPIWFIILPIVAICPLLFYLWRRKRRKDPRRASQENISPTSSESRSIASGTLEPPGVRYNASRNRSPIEQCAPDVVPRDSHPQGIKVEEFEEYVKEALSRGLLDSQYETFSKGFTKGCDYGNLPENVFKNRYRNLTAYDDTRVILEKVYDDPYSDYINANYVQGYKSKKAYIATQGPLQKTVKDFWRMIWEKEVRVICMLANIVERGKTKCEKYWPDVGTKVKYGNVIISNTKHIVFADYTFRTFTLHSQRKTREVTHLHYTGWPDHGVPMYTQSLVSYIKKLDETPTGGAPVVIHCSAGIGRTGTIILCDICLKQGNAEKVIDVPAVIMRMREDRANMVDTAQQYLLAHLTIVESMVPAQTQVSCNHVLPENIKELRKQLPSDMQRLNDTVWQDRALHSLAAPIRPVPKGAGIPEVIPDDPDVPEFQFSPTLEDESNYTKFVSVDGVKMKNQYLASGLPSSTTIPKIWKLIAERRIELVVILQPPDAKDPTFCDMMPTESPFVPACRVEVERKTSLVEEEYFSVDKLSLTDCTSEDESRSQPVTVLTCNGWSNRRKGGKPPNAIALVSLWRASEKIARKESPTLVLCRDGVTACGLYLALSFLLERMAVERECDVISAVRAVRRSKPEFVQSMDQFEYLYDAAEYYIKCFETYANFS